MSTEVKAEEVIEAKEWFLSKRTERLNAWEALPQETKPQLTEKLEAIREINKLDTKFEQILNIAEPALKLESRDYIVKNTAKAPTQEQKPVFYVNADVVQDIAEFRKQSPEIDKQVSGMSREALESEYFLKLMKREGYQPGLTISQDIAKYRQDHPSLHKRAEVMPRDRLENDYLLNQMKKNGYDPVVRKYEEFLNRPENAEIKKEAENLVSHIRNPKVKARMLFKEKAPTILRAKGIKL